MIKKKTKAELKKQSKKDLKKEIKVKDDEWKKKVFDKYGKKCIITGDTNYVQVHHFFPKKQYPQLRWVVENGVPLERSIHFKLERLKQFDIIYQIIIIRGLAWLKKLRSRL